MIADALAQRSRISLDAVDDFAALQTRVDRKYLIDSITMAHLLEELPGSAHVLEIGELTEFAYRSTYFDTDDLALYRAAVQGRRLRFKVRTRSYVDTGGCYLEVKAKGRRGQNVKSRIEWTLDGSSRLSATGRAFIDDATGTTHISPLLEPIVTTEYTRSTIVDVATAGRLTVDRSLRCTDRDGRVAALDAVVVETKSNREPSGADRWLWRHGVRPQRISKFCTGMAALDPDLPSNRWHRVLQHHWLPASA